jgi:hypothetical protein
VLPVHLRLPLAVFVLEIILGKDAGRSRQKDTCTREPIVFQSPGLKPDVRLTVCGQEFHVHSVILKLHSNFFRKFLDSPEKEAAPASSPFKYDYASVIDADGFSGLEPVTAANIRRSYYCDRNASSPRPFRSNQY